MIKKIVAFSMMAMMAVVSLSACGGGSDDNNGTPSTPTAPTGVVNVTGEGTVTATSNANYTFAAGNYTYTIDGFAAGNVLTLPSGFSAPSITNENWTDGIVLVNSSSSVNRQTISVKLTGITAENDKKINFANDVDTVFGVGTVVNK